MSFQANQCYRVRPYLKNDRGKKERKKGGGDKVLAQSGPSVYTAGDFHFIYYTQDVYNSIQGISYIGFQDLLYSHNPKFIFYPSKAFWIMN